MTYTTADIDLQAYLDRVDYTGSLDITPDVLSALVRQHMATIPFEVIDVLLDRGVDLNPAAVDDKLLTRHRGGYCFEHTSLLRRALQAIGFDVRQHLARVWVGGNPEQDPPRPASHTSLKVTVGGDCWLVDAGFGGFTPNVPLAWQPLKAQHTDYGAYRLRETRDGTVLESRFQEQWAPLYEVLDFNWQAADFKVANHFTATHPDSHFRNELMVALTGHQGRTTLAGNRLKTTTIDGNREERLLGAAELAEVLATTFGLPVEPGWRPLLERVVANAESAAEG